MLWRSGDLNAILETPYDGVLVTLFILISNPVTSRSFALAVRLAQRQGRRLSGADLAAETRLITGLILLVG